MGVVGESGGHVGLGHVDDVSPLPRTASIDGLSANERETEEQREEESKQ